MRPWRTLFMGAGLLERREVLDWRSIDHILLIRHDGIGDAVLTTPVFDALKQAVPHASLTVLALPDVCHLLEPDPHIDELIPYIPGRGDLCLPRLAAAGFGLAVDFRGRAENVRFARGTGARHVLSFDFERTGLADIVAPSKYRSFVQDPRHQTQVNAALLEAAGICPAYPQPALYFRDVDLRRAAAFASSVMTGMGQLLLLIHPLASVPSKQWPVEHFLRLAQDLRSRYGACVVLCGTPDQVSGLRQCSTSLTDCGAVHFEGDLSALGALQAMAHLVITVDTGPMHMAAAVGAPVVAVFGAANLVSHWRPLGDRHRVVTVEAACGPCHMGRCPSGRYCIREIGYDEVWSAVQERLMTLHGRRPAY